MQLCSEEELLEIVVRGLEKGPFVMATAIISIKNRMEVTPSKWR